MLSLQTRLVTKREWTDIKAIDEQAFPIKYRLTKDELSVMRRFQKVLVVEDPTEGVLGYASCNKNSKGNCFDILRIAVYPEFQRMGIGSELIDGIINHTRRNPASLSHVVCEVEDAFIETMLPFLFYHDFYTRKKKEPTVTTTMVYAI